MYLSRVDVHSAVVSTALVVRAPDVRGLPGWDAVGPLSRQAHHAVREAILGTVGREQREAAQRAMRDRAAALGVVAIHEMAGPTISSEDDLAGLLALAGVEPGPLATGYWGELARDGGIERAQALGAIGVGGDLFMDGALGSRTACLCDPYADAPGTTGAAYLDADEVAEHVVAATRAGLQAGFHVIGDAASQTVVDGLTAAESALGAAGLRAGQHRLEHAELLSTEHIATLARLGVSASMQPMFDGLWGGPGGMYEQRLGADRAARHEPVRRPDGCGGAGRVRLRRAGDRPRALGRGPRSRAPQQPRAAADRPGGVLRAHPSGLAGGRGTGHRHPCAGRAGPPGHLGESRTWSSRHRTPASPPGRRTRGRAPRDCRTWLRTSRCPAACARWWPVGTVFDCGEIDAGEIDRP